MSPSRLAVGALVMFTLTACNGSPPPDPSGAPIGTAAAAASGPLVCAALPRTDVMILESSPDQNQAGLSGITSFTGTSKGGTRGYTLMRFDLSALPSGAQIASATVTVAPTATRGVGTVDVHEIRGAWDPATVTWDDFSAPYDAAPAASFPSGVAPWSADAVTTGLAPATFDLTALAQRWASGVDANDGVLLEQSLVETSQSYTYYDDSAPTIDVCYAEQSPCFGVTCAASDACHAAGACDPATGACSNPAAPDGTPCEDGDACTTNDACVAGTCVGGPPRSCDDGDVCTADSCDPVNGCSHTPTSCDDGLACTVDTCAAATGCQHLVTCSAGASCSADFCGSPLGQMPQYAWLCQ